MISRAAIDAGHFHAVRFYNDADGLSCIVADFLADGLAAGQPAIVIATPPHVVAIERRLRERAIDVDDAKERCGLVLLDADGMLAEFMVDRMPDPSRFRLAITSAIDTAHGAPEGAIMRAYGEMVDVLWKAGNTVAAIRLEALWNALAYTHAFSLVCGYAVANTYKDGAVEDICRQHSHVMSETGQPAIVS